MGGDPGGCAPSGIVPAPSELDAGTFWFNATSKDFTDRSVTVEGSINQLQLIKQ